MSAPAKVFVATSNPGKLREYRRLAGSDSAVDLELLPGFDSIPSFEENASTFAENAAGKALHYSRLTSDLVLAEDSGLVVHALGGAPGPRSARYGDPNFTDADRVQKLLVDLASQPESDRSARFVAVIVLARRGEAIAVFSDFVEGIIAKEPRGANGFGYDPIFHFPPLQKTFAELPPDLKNEHSHRARAFRKVLSFLRSRQSALLL